MILTVDKEVCLSLNDIVLCLNDMGGEVINVSYDVTATLRASSKHHEPIVLVYESHGQDCRYKLLPDVCSTVSQKYGTGGGNAPIVVTYGTEDVCREEIL